MLLQENFKPPYLDNKTGKRDLASIDSKKETIFKSKKEKLHILSAALYSGISSLSSTDEITKTTEKAASDLGLGLSISWEHLWSEKISFFTTASIKKFEFKVAENRTIDKSDITQSYIGVGLNLKINDRLSLTPEIGIGEHLLLKSSGSSSLSVDKVSISNASLGAKVKLFKFKSGFSLDLNGKYSHMLPTKTKGYDTKSGSSYQVGFGSSYELNGKRLFINTNYTERSVNINDADQTSKDLGVTTGVGWSF